MARTKLKIVIRDTHRGLRYEDGVLVKVLEAGRYKIPLKHWLFWPLKPRVEVVLVDMRERDLTIKGQESGPLRRLRLLLVQNDFCKDSVGV